MSNDCENGVCMWSDSGQFCETLSSASVPVDGKWPLLILYLRGIKDFSFLSEVQKSSLQDLLLKLLREKAFSDNNYDATQKDIYKVITSPLSLKLEEIARETAELAKDMQSLFGKRTREVSSVATNVDENLARGVEPAALLANLRDDLKDLVGRMEEDANALASLSHKDSLTGLANRRSFDAFLSDAVTAWVKQRDPLSLIMFDIDHFKKFNDTYGHLVGDQVLRTLSKLIQKVTAPLEKDGSKVLAARYGGEEFALVLRGKISSRAVDIGEMLRKTLQKTGLLLRDPEGEVLQSGIRVTVSVGIAHMWEGWQSVYQSNLVDSADKALYHAKRNGRNCTVRFDPRSGDGYVLVRAE